MSVLSFIFGQSRATIGSVTIDASVSETHSDTSDVTENPVEQGAKITDHVQIKPKQLTIQGVISDTPINFAFVDNVAGAINTVKSYLGGTTRSIDAYNRLVDIQRKRDPITVITGLRVYSNMILQNISVNRTATTGKAVHFTAELREIRIAGTGFLASLESLATDAQNIGAETVNRGNQVTKTLPPPSPAGSLTNVNNVAAKTSTGAAKWYDAWALARQ